MFYMAYWLLYPVQNTGLCFPVENYNIMTSTLQIMLKCEALKYSSIIHY